MASGTDPEERDWSAYFDAVAGKPPRETLLAALDLFDSEPPRRPSPLAADLGCGEGRDTFELLRRGWSVAALDREPEALRRVMARVAEPERGRIRTILGSYEDRDWGEVDLVNASYSIPHCREGTFETLWTRIVASLRPGGRFAGQLFGIRDGWTPDPAPGWRAGRQFHSREQIEAMLAAGGLEPEVLREVEEDGRTALGDPKHWHLFHIVARKR